MPIQFYNKNKLLQNSPLLLTEAHRSLVVVRVNKITLAEKFLTPAHNIEQYRRRLYGGDSIENTTTTTTIHRKTFLFFSILSYYEQKNIYKLHFTECSKCGVGETRFEEKPRAKEIVVIIIIQ